MPRQTGTGLQPPAVLIPAEHKDPALPLSPVEDCMETPSPLKTTIPGEI